MRRWWAAVGALVLSATVQAADPPAMIIELGPRDASATPIRRGFTHTGGGNILVSQASPDTVVVTMTGVAVAGGHPCKDSLAALTFELRQGFEIATAKPDIKKVKLSLEARVIGLLRSHAHGGGAASIDCPARAAVTVCDGPAVLEVGLPARSVGRARIGRSTTLAVQ